MPATQSPTNSLSSELAVSNAIDALRISALLGVIIAGIILILEIISIVENRYKLSIYQPSRRWRITLILSTFFAILVFILDLVAVFVSWTPDYQEACDLLTNFMALFYIVEKQFVNLFFYDRAKIVHLTLHLDSQLSNLVKLRIFLFITLAAGIPVFFYWSAFVAFGGSIIGVEQVCVFHATFPQVIIAFALTDALLSAGMIYIFVAPLMVHGTHEAMDPSGTTSSSSPYTRKLQKVVRQNITASTIAIGSGLFALITMSILEFFANQQATDDLQTRYQLQVWALFTISWDTLFSLVAIHGCTHSWLPFKVREKVRHHSAAQSMEDTTKKQQPIIKTSIVKMHRSEDQVLFPKSFPKPLPYQPLLNGNMAQNNPMAVTSQPLGNSFHLPLFDPNLNRSGSKLSGMSSKKESVQSVVYTDSFKSNKNPYSIGAALQTTSNRFRSVIRTNSEVVSSKKSSGTQFRIEEGDEEGSESANSPQKQKQPKPPRLRSRTPSY